MKNLVEKYLAAYRERRQMEKEIDLLRNDQHKEKRNMKRDLKFKQGEENRLLIELDQYKCGKSLKGHEFPPVDGELSDSPENSKNSRTCTRCGFEKK